MKQNDDRRTVQGCDLLVPGLGELIGSSVREHDYNKLMKIVEERKMDITPLKWYIDLRKNGSTPTAGAGLGFEGEFAACWVGGGVMFISFCIFLRFSKSWPLNTPSRLPIIDGSKPNAFAKVLFKLLDSGAAPGAAPGAAACSLYETGLILLLEF